MATRKSLRGMRAIPSPSRRPAGARGSASVFQRGKTKFEDDDGKGLAKRKGQLNPVDLCKHRRPR